MFRDLIRRKKKRTANLVACYNYLSKEKYCDKSMNHLVFLYPSSQIHTMEYHHRVPRLTALTRFSGDDANANTEFELRD